MTAPEVTVIAAWHEALNHGDIERLVELSHPDVEVGGPRGTGKGAQLLRECVARANIDLEPQRAFYKGDTVVMQQEAKWRSAETGELSGSEQVASAFLVRDGLVHCVTRYRNLAGALRAASLDGSYEVPEGCRVGVCGSDGGIRTL